MATEERTRELIIGLYNAVVDMDEAAAADISRTLLKEGVDACIAVTEGLAAAMDRVGELYANREYFVPELLLCSDALYAGLEILKPHIKTGEAEVKRQIVLGTVEGDIHDIGKNLVKVMFEAAGWIVHDLGKDVKLERFVEVQKKTKAGVVGISALMTTSMLAMPRVIEMLRAEDPGAAIVLGGAPVTRQIAERYGADGYADTAAEAVQEAINILDRIKNR